MTIKEALEYGVEKLKNNDIQEPIQKARLILAFVLCKKKEYLISHDNEIVRRRRNKKVFRIYRTSSS